MDVKIPVVVDVVLWLVLLAAVWLGPAIVIKIALSLLILAHLMLIVYLLNLFECKQ